MTLTPEHREKLLKLVRLANFLDDLPHDKFMIGWFSSADRTTYSCGTAGCVGGWAATVFNKDWEFPFGLSGLSSVPRLQLNSSNHIAADFATFFGLTEQEARRVCMLPSDCEYITRYTAIKPVTPRDAALRLREAVRHYDATLLKDRSKPAFAAEDKLIGAAMANHGEQGGLK